MIPSPLVSNWGRPARPKICCTSSIPSSPNAPFWASYTLEVWRVDKCVGGGIVLINEEWEEQKKGYRYRDMEDRVGYR